MVRTEFEFHSNEENVNTYLSRMAQVIESMDYGVVLEDGSDYSKLLKDEEKAEIKTYVWTVMQPIVDESVRYICHHHNLGNLAEDYRQKFYENVWKNFFRFNNPRYKKQETAYAFETFINTYTADALRMTLRQHKGYGKTLDNNCRKVKRTKDYLMKEVGMRAEEITVDDIYMFMPEVTVNPISRKEIIHVLEVTRGNYSIDAMENGEEQFEQMLVFNNVDPEFANTIISFVTSMRPMQQFLFLQNYGFCNNHFAEVTMKQMSCDDVFLRLCRADEVGCRHIKHGTLIIERPRIEVGERQQKKVVKDTDYVEEKFIRNERDRSRKNLISLVKEYEYEAGDFEGVITNVLLNQWVRLMDEIKNM